MEINVEQVNPAEHLQRRLLFCVNYFSLELEVFSPAHVLFSEHGKNNCFIRIHVDYGGGQDCWCKYSSLAI